MCSIDSGLCCWDPTPQAASDDAPSQSWGWRGVLSFSFEVRPCQCRETLPCKSLRRVRVPNIIIGKNSNQCPMHMIINVVEERNNYQDLKQDMRKLECLVCLKFLSSVRYGAGRGGFSLARPRPYTEPGGVCFGYSPPRPHPGSPALIPWTGPRLLPPIFNGDPSGVCVGRGPERGQGQGMPKKAPRPRPLSGAGRGKGPGARVFRGPVRPVTNSILKFTYPRKTCVIHHRY